MRDYLLSVWHSAAETNNQRLIQHIPNSRSNQKILDLGSYHPDLVTSRFAHLDSPHIYTVDTNPHVVRACRQAGFHSTIANVEKKLPFANNSFDIVTANQIIEHLLDVDRFVSEVYRVLKPSGTALISTENLSSWHNIFALVMGWQAFSQHISYKKNIGNPFRLPKISSIDPSGMHVKIFTLRGLSELMQIYGFTDIQVFSGGYIPFTNPLSSWFSSLDPIHAVFIGLSATKS